METVETMTGKAQAMFADANERAKGAMAKGARLIEELNALNQGHVEAIVQSSRIAAKGVETLGQDAAAYARQSFEEAAAAARTLASATSPAEFLKLQGDYARRYFDGMVAHGSRSTEAMLKLTGEIVQPISNRLAIAADTIKVAA